MAEAERIARWLRAPVIPANSQKQTFLKNWPSLTFQQSIKPASLILFRGDYQNVAVVQGKSAGGLCSVDWDEEDCYQEFMALNPKFGATLASQAKRSPNLWVRMTGEFPKLTPLRRDGRHVGEWRSDGAYTIIHGRYQSGTEYRNNGKDPIELGFNEVLWPARIHPFTDFTEIAESTETTEITEITDDVGGRGVAIASFEQAVSLSTPTEPHTTCETQFRFCRALKNLEGHRGERLSPAELREAFDLWYQSALPCLRPDQSKDKYFFEFMDRFNKTKVPLGTNRVLEHVLKLVSKEPPPKEAEQYEDPQIRLTISLLYYLQKETGDQPFYLSTRTCARVLGNVSHTQVAQWFRGFKTIGLIEEVEKGTAHRAPRLKYRGS